MLARAARVAPTRVPVLVSGESGTGKELLARLIHHWGPAPAGPFVAVNCGTLPRELAESELFGHERGAFTGAGGRKAGWFEEADEGTLVLDEIGELPRDLQPKLLRVLETGRLRRVGGSGEVPVRVRVVALTLRDLRREIDCGMFRVDLFHRLAGFELALPPLRRRREDIPLLATRFLTEMEPEMGPRVLEPNAVEALQRHDWPGNVRELRNVLRRAAIMCPQRIDTEALELPSGGYSTARTFDGLPPADTLRLADGEVSGHAPTPFLAETGARDVLPLGGQTFDQIERAVLRWALHRSGGSRRRAARSLAIPRSTLCDKVKRYGLS